MNNQHRTHVAPPSPSPGVWFGVVIGLIGGLALGAFGFGGRPTSASSMDVSVNLGELAGITTDGGTEDVLIVIDQRAEQLMVYHVRAQTELQFLQRYSVRELFQNARLQFGRPSSPAPVPAPGGR